MSNHKNFDSDDRNNTIQQIQHLMEQILKLMAKIPYNELPENFRKLLDTLMTDDDLDEKREVYQIISEFISKELKIVEYSPQVCIGAAYILCKETNKILLRDSVNKQSEDLALSLKKNILKIQVIYQSEEQNKNHLQESCKRYIRKVKIFWLKNQKTFLYEAESQVDWDYLPSDVRESFLRQESDNVSFKLYPQE